ncbi:MAG: hypothetical protein BRD57_06340 [Proteobacteria bacterium SW_6_67_9]|nr:MAG: hypothetical protein BRD57_06340 [Proteobacteria bacterium SW_6_67_9]
MSALELAGLLGLTTHLLGLATLHLATLHLSTYLLTAHLAGRLIAEAIDGEGERFETLAALRNYSFPGGRTLRVPLTMLGAWYYLAKEKIGL